MTRTVLFTTFLAAGLLCLASPAQEKSAPKKKSTAPAAPAGPAMPKPAPEMKALRSFVGTWTTDEQFEASPMGPAGTGSGTNVARLGPGGFSVMIDQRSKGSMGAFSGHGVYAWDAEGKVYKAAWVDSMTPALTVETGHKEGENLVFTGEVTMGGKKIAVRDVWSDFTPTSHVLTSYNNDGSGEKKMMTIKFIKQEPAPPAEKK